MLTTQEAAARAGVKPVTIRKWISEGKLAAVKFGRDWQITEKTLDALTTPEPAGGRFGGPGREAGLAGESPTLALFRRLFAEAATASPEELERREREQEELLARLSESRMNIGERTDFSALFEDSPPAEGAA